MYTSPSGKRLPLDSRLLARVLGKGLRHPDRALKRLLLRRTLAWQEEFQALQTLLAFLADTFAVDSQALYAEYLQSEIAAWCRERRVALARLSVPYRFGSSGEFGGAALYLLVRAAQPQRVVETGVLYGASSAYLLAALAHNGTGELYSIDPGNAPHEPPNDFFVPPHLQERWHLRIGESQHALLDLLDDVGPIDLFHHDSLHTFEHMLWEYETAWRALAPQGVLSSDDVHLLLSLRTPFRRNPFQVFCEHHHLRWIAVHNFGMAVRCAAHRLEAGRQR
jgi:predicted O-methyltransferase YrrM